MRIIDLTHPLSEGMPLWPGSRPPSFSRSASLEKDGFCETRLEILSHTGTHLDAPGHMIPGDPTLDQLPVDRFIGRAMLADLQGSAGVIGIAHLEKLKISFENNEFLLLRTGWDRHWGKPCYYSGFPVLSIAAVRWLLQFHLKGIGVDTPSVDAAAGNSRHRLLLGAGMLIIENLKLDGLDKVEAFLFSCLPLPFPGADGSPVRAVAILD